LAVESPKNMLVDSFNNSYLVATTLIMNAINRALDKRTNLIFAELISNAKVCFSILLFLIFKGLEQNLSQKFRFPEENERDFERILTRLLFKCIYTRLTVCKNA
jgi:hypothetical protein